MRAPNETQEPQQFFHEDGSLIDEKFILFLKFIQRGLNGKKLLEDNPLGLLQYGVDLLNIAPLVNKLWEEVGNVKNKQLKLSNEVNIKLDVFFKLAVSDMSKLDKNYTSEKYYNEVSPDLKKLIKSSALSIVIMQAVLGLTDIELPKLRVHSAEEAANTSTLEQQISSAEKAASAPLERRVSATNNAFFPFHKDDNDSEQDKSTCLMM